jgi:hypothetical protein
MQKSLGGVIVRKKRLLSGILALTMTMSLLAGCAGSGSSAETTAAPTEAQTEQQTEETTEEPTTEAPVTASARISCEGTKFVVDGNEIWINGANVPWDNWNDFGGTMDGSFWDQEFSDLHDAGINAVRVWITCNGDVGIDIDENGYVTGATDSHWSALNLLFALAERHHIYIMATLISFDHFKDSNQKYQSWRNMINDNDAIDSYVENYLKPFLEKFGDNEYLWSIDLCNEPDWIVENSECGRQSWDALGSYFARCAAAIHENSDVLVTVGFGMVKYNSENYSGDCGADEYLQSLYDNKNAYLDFYSTHFYEWEATWYGNPFESTPKEFGLADDKPALLGEMPASAMDGSVSGSTARTLTQCYEDLYANGWNGVMPWTANGVDGCGDLNDIAPAAQTILDAHEDLVFPLGDREIAE